VPSLFAQSGPEIDREQGLVTDRPFWRQALGGAVLSLPSVQAQSAVVALDGGNIRAYSTAGKPLWDYSAKGKLSPYVSRAREGTSYFSRTNGILIAVNRSGRELWQRTPGGSLCGKVISGWDGRIFVPTEKKISCYTASGTLLWSHTFESNIKIAPQLDQQGGIILSLDNNDVWRIGPFGDYQKWTLPKKPVILLSAGQKNTMQIISFFSDGTIYIFGAEDAANTLTSANGSEKSSLPKLPSSPLAAVNREDNIAVVLNDGKMYYISLDEGNILWSGDTHIRETAKGGNKANIEAEMIFDERGIYVLSKNGATGFTQDGRRLWYTILDDAAAIPAFGDDGVLYSGGQDWILYAFKMEDRKSPKKPLLYGPAAEGAYGTGRPLNPYSLDFPIDEIEVRTWLNQITNGINNGKIGTEELLWTSRLMTIASGNFHVQYRINAIELLGRIGSRETIPWLTGLFRRDTESLIKVTAANAIGAIGADPEGNAIRIFYESAILTKKMPDEQVLMAIASATGALCRFSGPPLSETGIKILNLLSKNSQPPLVRHHAQKELVSLR